MSHPYSDASLLSRLTFFWVRYLDNSNGNAKTLALPRSLSVRRTQPTFDRLLARHDSATAACLGAIRQKYLFVAAGVVMAFAECADVLVIYRLTALLEGAQRLTRSLLIRIAYFLALHILCELAGLPLAIHAMFSLQTQMVALRANLAVAVTERVLALGSSFAGNTALGSVTNLVQTDCENLQNCSYVAVTAPYYIVLFFLNGVAGFWLLGGLFWAYLGAFLILGPVSFYAIYLTSFYEAQMEQRRDKRMSLLLALFSSIRFVKFNVMEEFFVRVAHDLRRAELRIITRYLVAISVNAVVLWLLPAVGKTLFVWFWVCMGRNITKRIFVSALRLFGSVDTIFGSAPWTVQTVNRVRLALRRFDAFFAIKPSPPLSLAPPAEGFAVEVRGTFAYAADESARFVAELARLGKSGAQSPPAQPARDFQLVIDFRVQRGETVFVVGKIGSGKSSLVRALLSELQCKSGGEVRVAGTIAYCPQTPFLLSASVRDNILFYRKVDDSRLSAVCTAAQLDDDIATGAVALSRRLTENGANISSGQRARVCLARCLYESRDVYLLDDPFSALDAAVAARAFAALREELAGRTQIIVTHALGLLRDAPRVVYMEAGSVRFDGSYAEFALTPFGSELLAESPAEAELVAEPIEDVEDEESLSAATSVAGSLAEQGRRHLSLKDTIKVLYKYYGGGGLIPVLTLLTYGAMSLLYYSSELLTDYIERRTPGAPPNRAFLWRYTQLSCLPMVFMWMRFCALYYTAFRTSKVLMEKMLFSALHGELGYFERGGAARLATRFSSDFNLTDIYVPWRVSDATLLPGYVLLDAVVSCRTISFWAALPYMIYIVYCLILQRMFVPRRRALNEQGRAVEAPIVALLADAVRGAPVLAHFGVSSAFLEDMSSRAERAASVALASSAMSAGFDCAVSLSNIVLGQCLPFGLIVLLSSRIEPKSLVLYFTFAFGFGWNIYIALQGLGDAEVSAQSVARCDALTKLPSEPGYANLKSDARRLALKPDIPARAFIRTPKGDGKERYTYAQINAMGFDRRLLSAGRIVFDRVSARYGPDLPLAVCDFSLVVPGGCKLGVCGRTGSGKSTLVRLLARHLSPIAGSITIDDYDAAQVNLKTLRSELMIVSQEVTLFAGSLRENLRPELYGTCGAHKDDSETVASLLALGFHADKLAGVGLELRVEAGGENLSPGERQVIAFFRALASDRRVIVLDEATSSVDVETERRLVEFFYARVAGRTVITIAHRTSTLLGCDLVLAMQAGEMRELGSPAELLADSSSLFREYHLQTA